MHSSIDFVELRVVYFERIMLELDVRHAGWFCKMQVCAVAEENRAERPLLGRLCKAKYLCEKRSGRLPVMCSDNGVIDLYRQGNPLPARRQRLNGCWALRRVKAFYGFSSGGSKPVFGSRNQIGLQAAATLRRSCGSFSTAF